MPHDKKKLKSDSSAVIKSFSKNLLGLKFMQNAKNQAEKKAQEKDDSFQVPKTAQIKGKQQYIINQSYQFCERLRFGRLSFKGMNAEIEALTSRPNQQEKDGITPTKRQASSSSSSNNDSEVDNLDTPDEEEGEDEDQKDK